MGTFCRKRYENKYFTFICIYDIVLQYYGQSKSTQIKVHTYIIIRHLLLNIHLNKVFSLNSWQIYLCMYHYQSAIILTLSASHRIALTIGTL